MAIVMASLITTLVSALAFAAAESDGALKILWVVLAGWVIHEFARVWSRP